ncbi:hypothetical protein [Anaerobranca californiensis]|jgi:hypothetical protein|nr:hypothetical protein [Anaerobranca californiensis]
MRYYDGKFWPHVAKILNTDRLTNNFQIWIGESFINTLKEYNKVIIDENEKVKNVLMHGFVSEHYANNLFDFLFKFYEIDLERDLTRNSKEMMDNLVHIIRKNDNTQRTYLLVQQTSDAIEVNKRGAKVRLRRLLRLIDQCFYQQDIPQNSTSRMTILFNKWQRESEEFNNKIREYNLGIKKKKSYSAPFLKCNLEDNSFTLILPSQLINMEYIGDVKWEIVTPKRNISLPTFTYEGFTGLKIKEVQTTIDPQNLFDQFTIRLLCDQNKIKVFNNLKGEVIRFFDSEGNQISNLPKGEYIYSFIPKDQLPISQGIIDTEVIGPLLKTSYNFTQGDYIKLSDGTVITIDKGLAEGLLERNCLKDSLAIYNDEKLSIYNKPPTIYIQIGESKVKGTVIKVNGKVNRFLEELAVKVDVNRKGETGYYLNLQDYHCLEDDLYEIIVDVPNDRTQRYWKFILINDLQFNFEGAPYLFKTKGTIVFNEGLDLLAKDQQVEKNRDENSYNFTIIPERDYLEFTYRFKDEKVDLLFKIPVLKWSIDKESWYIQKNTGIWHSEFPSTMYIKGPFDKIKLLLDDDLAKKDNEHEKSYTKSKEGIFECDVSSFKSWFGREKAKRTIYIQLNGHKEEFLTVITRSYLLDEPILTNQQQKSPTTVSV